MEVNSKFSHETSEKIPIYVNPDQMSDINNIRLRHVKSNIPTEQPAHFILSADDFQWNEKDNDLHLMLQKKHNKTQIIFLVFTALSYLLYTLRAYILDSIPIASHFWSSIKSTSITRVYTSDLRPSLVIEDYLLRLSEICQTLWLVYILSYIPRRVNFGYLYRNPNIFNSFLCFLFITALSFQTISQTSLPPEILCACLFISFITLIIACRCITVKLIKYEEKIKTIELIIIRYFILNSIFLYTTLIAYLTICASIECFAFHIDPTDTLVTSATTTGLSIMLILLLIYFLFDRFVYENEFRSIWTPYLFIAIAFMCPPLRQLLSTDTYLITHDLNFYLLWILFSTTILIILIRICRQISMKYRAMKTKPRVNPYSEQVAFETET